MLSKQIIALSGLIAVTIASPFTHNVAPNNMPTVLVSNPSSQKVTSTTAFTNGAGNNNNQNTTDGIGAGKDVYNCYSGSFQDFPAKSKWISFTDMWNNAQSALKESCSNIESTGPGDSAAQITDILSSIQQVADTSLADHRFIFATIMQESSGCVNVETSKNPDPTQPDNPSFAATTAFTSTQPVSDPKEFCSLEFLTDNGHRGLMQSAGGSSFVGNSASAAAQAASITQMIIDGTQGTAKGDGLVQCINQYGNIYEAARCYNSGTVDPSDLNNGEGATSSYVNDIANRMTGWLNANNGESGFGSC
ncbi:hypothetical protein LSUE1_G006464 [Lachnellula suecica]|uniref:Transglycosylase SLT domain-containing protein n=1 Tax=Lachnellula suecica TaxID=602035 RepID=A0A8T9C0K5_9HELO|nr:hypothetical protein LSUE1_G006464 [Lachnellula suecica]